MTWRKDPGATLDYTIDWSRWIQPGETITTATATASNGATVDSTAIAGANVTAWISGGTAGKSTILRVEITTDQGRTDARQIRIEIAETTIERIE